MRIQVARGTGGVFSLKYHLVWCPKYRRPVLIGTMTERLKVLLAGKAAQAQATLHLIEVMPDHVHLFVETLPTCSPARLAGWFKGYTSHALRAEFRHLRYRFPTFWSRRYDIGTVGHVSEQTVRHYIESQRGR